MGAFFNKPTMFAEDVVCVTPQQYSRFNANRADPNIVRALNEFWQYSGLFAAKEALQTYLTQMGKNWDDVSDLISEEVVPPNFDYGSMTFIEFFRILLNIMKENVN